MLWLAQGADAFRAHGLELVMRHRQQDGIISALLQRGHRRDAIFVLRFGGVDPGVVHVGADAVVAQLFDDVDDAGVAQVGAVFLEGQAHHQHARAFDLDAAL